MTRKEFIDAVRVFEKAQKQDRTLISALLSAFESDYNREKCKDACEQGLYLLIKASFPSLTSEQAEEEAVFFTHDCDYGECSLSKRAKGKEYLIDGAGSFYDYLSGL